MVFCPKCPPDESKAWKPKVFMKLNKDEQGIPRTYECPKCGYSQELTTKQQVMEIIYGAKWFFGVPEYAEVDEFFIENEDTVFELLTKVIQAKRIS